MQASVEKIWESAQQSLRTMLNPDIYNLWFLPVKAVGMEEDTVVLEVANDFGLVGKRILLDPQDKNGKPRLASQQTTFDEVIASQRQIDWSKWK